MKGKKHHTAELNNPLNGHCCIVLMVNTVDSTRKYLIQLTRFSDCIFMSENFIQVISRVTSGNDYRSTQLGSVI